MSEALKPCPFCGGKAGATKDGDYHVVMCRECMASLADRTRRTALHMWNTRTDAITPAHAAKVLRCPDGFNALVDAFEAAEGDTAARMDEALKAVARTIAQEEKQ